MKATKSIVLLLALNKLRKRKILFRRKMKNLLLTFALFMQKQDYYYCSGYVSQVPQNRKTRRSRRYWMINYEQMWFEKMIARKDEPIFQELWKNEFTMLPFTFDLTVNLVKADTRKEDTYFLEFHTGLFLRFLVWEGQLLLKLCKSFTKLYARSLVPLQNFQKQEWR